MMMLFYITSEAKSNLYLSPPGGGDTDKHQRPDCLSLSKSKYVDPSNGHKQNFAFIKRPKRISVQVGKVLQLAPRCHFFYRKYVNLHLQGPQSQKLISVQVFIKIIQGGIFREKNKRTLHCTFISDIRVGLLADNNILLDQTFNH